jgi:putative membrane protein
MKLEQLGESLGITAAYAVLGVIVLMIAFWIMTKLAPFSVRKEIEEDQNTSLAILMGSVIIGLALVIAAAVHG